MFLPSLLALSISMSCVSIQDRAIPAHEVTTTEVIGTVTVEFVSFQFFHIPNKTKIKNKAYMELKKLAILEYGENVDIKNITIDGNFSAFELAAAIGGAGLGFAGGMGAGHFSDGTGYVAFPIVGMGIGNLIGNAQKIVASGDVVYHMHAGTAESNRQRLGNALQRVGQTLIERLPDNSTIAVLSILSPSRDISEYIVDELEYQLVNSSKFAIVDRRRLDQIRTEQNFQMSEDVDDNSAISIGNMLGASIVLTGNIGNIGTTQVLNVKALDVKTARIITMAREQF
jgi:hypothetical protein